MKTQFYILLSLRTPGGFENYGHFDFGHDREAADKLFTQLEGSKELTDRCILHIDLMETVNLLPVKIKTICCTLDQFARNSKLIAREIFKQKNLKDWVW
ncbi:MAG: hypothetical protein JSU01_00465 [Bacteroidetes bacterium]|nr:hypothetical protein [Bacteroidota bacterium]